MQYHALSLANTAHLHVDIVGYSGAPLLKDIRDSPLIRAHLLEPPKGHTSRIRKALFQFLQLMWTLLFVVPRPCCIFVQNPPAIPTLVVAWIVSLVRWCDLVIDWHNFGYTLLALSQRKSQKRERQAVGVDGEAKGGLLVRISEHVERFAARRAQFNFTVTRAMKDHLVASWHVDPGQITVLYDRAHEQFQRQNAQEAHSLFLRLLFSVLPEEERESAKDSSKTRFTQKDGQDYAFRQDRPALIVTSSSWSEDEDFSLLLEALRLCDARLHTDELNELKATNRSRSTSTSSSPARDPTEVGPLAPGQVLKWYFVCTGIGPMRAHYIQQCEALRLYHIRIHFVWLDAPDYPRLLGCSDLGLSFHQSSSGFDLPMKVVDMFGSELPVCALNFSCIGELVRDGQNGRLFRTGPELAQHLLDLFRDFPSSSPASPLAAMRAATADFASVRWNASWRASAAPVFQRYAPAARSST